MSILYEQITQACTTIKMHARVTPRIGLILGSGLAALADELTQAAVIPYASIPGFHEPKVPGHRGELAIGSMAGQSVAVLRGRFHFYEGYSMAEVTFPVRVLKALGCQTLIVTNAAGGLHADWQVGDIMRITDHIFLPGLMGMHPLIGANDDRLGPRFPAMLNAYQNDLVPCAHAAAASTGVRLRSGVYAMLAGPSFETAAEMRMLRAMGADAVGMSTAPEVVVARHAGMRVLGFSLITNLALPDGSPANHAEVLEAGEKAKPRFAAMLRQVLAQVVN
ncbi:MAG: purine-nucleoside phosphorylase [Chloroflexia bacterium]|jgi:purine-nucleoside phosphorylase|nr:purine-nucleoside phosphorylase [Chloroflexia bacterium]